MENQSQWDKICTGDFHHPQKDVPISNLERREYPSSREREVFGLHLDRRLNWRRHISTERKQLGIQLSKMYWMLDSKSQLSIESKLLLYKAILKPIWIYGVQLWGTVDNSNIEIIQRFQNKYLRIIVDAPWYHQWHSTPRSQRTIC